MSPEGGERDTFDCRYPLLLEEVLDYPVSRLTLPAYRTMETQFMDFAHLTLSLYRYLLLSSSSPLPPLYQLVLIGTQERFAMPHESDYKVDRRHPRKCKNCKFVSNAKNYKKVRTPLCPTVFPRRCDEPVKCICSSAAPIPQALKRHNQDRFDSENGALIQRKRTECQFCLREGRSDVSSNQRILLFMMFSHSN